MVRILQVTKELGSGGIEAVVCGWYNNIDKGKIDFDFALHWHGREGMHEDEVLQKGAKIYRFKTLAECGSMRKYKKQWATFWREHSGEYSVVHIHYMSHAALIADVAKKYGVATVIHSHSTSPYKKSIDLKSLISKFLNRKLHTKADIMLACSQKAGTDFFGDVFNSCGKVIKNAIDINRYSYDETVRKALRHKYDLDDKIVIGHIGNYTAHKNQDFMLKIFSNIVSINPNVHLIWGGGYMTLACVILGI